MQKSRHGRRCMQQSLSSHNIQGLWFWPSSRQAALLPAAPGHPPLHILFGLHYHLKCTVRRVLNNSTILPPSSPCLLRLFYSWTLKCINRRVQFARHIKTFNFGYVLDEKCKILAALLFCLGASDRTAATREGSRTDLFCGVEFI